MKILVWCPICEKCEIISPKERQLFLGGHILIYEN